MTKLRLAALALVAAGCAGDLPPRSLLQDLRVLALLAKPLEAGPGESVAVSAYRLPPPGATIAQEAWSFCPFTVGASASDACAVPACEVALTPASDGSVSADPGAEAAACLQKYGAGAVAGSPLPAQVPDQLQTLFRYRVTASDQSAREAVLRVPFYPRGAPSERNAPPVVNAITVGGQTMYSRTPSFTATQSAPIPKGGQLEVRVTLDAASVQQYQDSSGRTVSEQLFASFYTTDGRFDYDRGVGLDESVNLKDDKVADRATPARVYVVAHDDRGGAAVFGPYAVPFTP